MFTINSIPHINDLEDSTVFSNTAKFHADSEFKNLVAASLVAASCILPLSPCMSASSMFSLIGRLPSLKLLVRYSSIDFIIGKYSLSCAFLNVPSYSAFGENTRRVSVSRYRRRSLFMASLSPPILALSSWSPSTPLVLSRSMHLDTREVSGRECCFTAESGTRSHSCWSNSPNSFLSPSIASLLPRGVLIAFESSSTCILFPGAVPRVTFFQNFLPPLASLFVSL